MGTLILRLVGGDSGGEVTLMDYKYPHQPPVNYWIYNKSGRLRYGYVLVSIDNNVFTYQYAGREDDSIYDNRVEINNHGDDQTC